MYRKTECGIWDDPKVKKLQPLGKLLFSYLFTNRHSHVSGLYYLPIEFQSHELGITVEKLRTLWDTLSIEHLAYFDSERSVVFVPKMLKHQGAGQKHYLAAVHQASTLHDSPLIDRLREQYPILLRYPINGVSGVGLPESGSGLGSEAGTESDSDSSSSSPRRTRTKAKAAGSAGASRDPDPDPDLPTLRAMMVQAVQRHHDVPWVAPDVHDGEIASLLYEGVSAKHFLDVWEFYVETRRDPAKISIEWFVKNFNTFQADYARARALAAMKS